MAVVVNGNDILYTQLAPGDLVCFEPTASPHQPDNYDEAFKSKFVDNMLAELEGKEPIHTDKFLVLDLKMSGLEVEVSFLCCDDSNRSLVVERFPVLSPLGSGNHVILGKIPLEDRAPLTPKGFSIKETPPPPKVETISDIDSLIYGSAVIFAIFVLAVCPALFVIISNS